MDEEDAASGPLRRDVLLSASGRGVASGVADDAVLRSNSMVHTVNDDDAGPSAFNAPTLTADDGSILWNFDTIFRNSPMLAFGRRGGGIEDVRVLPNGSGGSP